MQVAVLETSFIHVSLNTSLHALLNSQHIQKKQNKAKPNQTKPRNSIHHHVIGKLRLGELKQLGSGCKLRSIIFQSSKACHEQGRKKEPGSKP